MKRIRTVFKNHQEVCHVWAQQKQREGRASNIFFDGPSIYSYGRHFEMARFITPEVVFINCRSYSVSTSKHQSYVRQAVNHKTTFHVPSMDSHTENAEYFIKEAELECKKAMAAVKRANQNIGSMRGNILEYESYIQEFEITGKLKRNLDARVKVLEKVDFSKKLLQCKNNQEKERERNQIKAESRYLANIERGKKEAENIEAWKRGEYHGSFNWVPDIYLRVEGNEVVTTKGARVPLERAVDLYCRIKKRESVHGIEIGHYTVNGYADQVLTVGCHKIPMAEMDRIAQEIKLVDSELKLLEVK